MWHMKSKQLDAGEFAQKAENVYDMPNTCTDSLLQLSIVTHNQKITMHATLCYIVIHLALDILETHTKWYTAKSNRPTSIS